MNTTESETMNTIGMKPDATYTRLQRELQTLIGHGHFDRQTKLKRELESKFMAAWHFSPDRRRLGVRLRDTILNQLTGRALDHSSCYSGANDQCVIVAQPYGDYEAELKRDLRLVDGTTSEIVVATEWGFHYSGL